MNTVEVLLFANYFNYSSSIQLQIVHWGKRLWQSAGGRLWITSRMAAWDSRAL